MSIRFEKLSFSYSEERKNTINEFDASFEAGRITILTGPSGCGKSTLLYLASGVYPHNAGILKGGCVRIAGRNPSEIPPQERCRLVGMMFQNSDLQFCMDTVRNELIFCLENIQTPVEEIENKLSQALDFCQITQLEHRMLGTLSGGEKQKVMLACLAAINPKWLLLDEPFANVDSASAAEIAAKLRKLCDERGTSILAVDHRLDHWIGVADEIRVMQNSILLDEHIDAHHPDAQQLERLGVIAPHVSYKPELNPPKPGEEVLRLEKLQLKHGDRDILSDVSYSFRQGLIYAVVGESGCGKSSLFGVLSGLYPYRGSALLQGREIKRLRRRDAGMIGFVTQSPQDQFVAATVRQELLISLRNHPDANGESERILRSIGLWTYRDVSAYILSQGQQRRLGVAALLAYSCKVLVCDEPTYAQDRKNTLEIMKGLCCSARKNGFALIFSTHDRRLAQDYADVILELRGGRLHETY